MRFLLGWKGHLVWETTELAEKLQACSCQIKTKQGCESQSQKQITWGWVTFQKVCLHFKSHNHSFSSYENFILTKLFKICTGNSVQRKQKDTTDHIHIDSEINKNNTSTELYLRFSYKLFSLRKATRIKKDTIRDLSPHYTSLTLNKVTCKLALGFCWHNLQPFCMKWLLFKPPAVGNVNGDTWKPAFSWHWRTMEVLGGILC